MQELLEKRTYTAKHFDNGDGTFTLRAHTGHVHYKEGDELEEVDFHDIQDKGDYYEMTKASYKLRVAKNFSEEDLITFTNNYEDADHTIVYKPVKLAWIKNDDFENLITHSEAQSVTSTLNENVIRFENAFGEGIHFEVTSKRHGFTKEVVLDGNVSRPGHELIALFKYNGEGLNLLDSTGAEWDGESFFESEKGYQFAEKAKSETKSLLRPAYIMDSSEPIPTMGSIRVFWNKKDGDIYQAKMLPKKFLETAVYPVRADTTTDFDATTEDGYHYYTSGSWSTIYNATASQGYIDTSTNGYGMIFDTIATNRVYYPMFPCDTSSIPDTDEVSAAAFYIYPTAVLKASTHYWDLCGCNVANPAAIAAADFDTFNDPADGGTITNDTALNSFQSISVTDLTIVNKTGTTTIGLVPRGLLTNTAPSNNQNAIQFDYANGTNVPYLQATYAAAASSDIKSLVGITQADIKSVTGVTEANIKSITGVTN